MPDDPAFLRMIAATPDDDAPRLVYADVLDERGDPASVARAEFIRIQCERARHKPDSPEWRELWHRDTALLDWAKRWREELPGFHGVIYGGFIRGFIDHVSVTGEPFAQYFRLIVDSVPIRKLTLGEMDKRTASVIAGCPHLAEVSELEFYPSAAVTADILWPFADRGPWPRLQRLRVPMPEGNRRGGRHRSWRQVRKALQAKFGGRLTT